eukprot:263275_1
MDMKGFRWQNLSHSGKAKLICVPIVSTLCLSTLYFIKQLVEDKTIPELQIIGLSPIQKEVKQHLTYNISKTIFALSLLPVIYITNSRNFKTFFKFGHVYAPVQSSKLYQLFRFETNHTNWKQFGVSMSLSMSCATAAFLYYFKVRHTKITNLKRKFKDKLP